MEQKISRAVTSQLHFKNWGIALVQRSNQTNLLPERTSLFGTDVPLSIKKIKIDYLDIDQEERKLWCCSLDRGKGMPRSFNINGGLAILKVVLQNCTYDVLNSVGPTRKKTSSLALQKEAFPAMVFNLLFFCRSNWLTGNTESAVSLVWADRSCTNPLDRVWNSATWHTCHDTCWTSMHQSASITTSEDCGRPRWNDTQVPIYDERVHLFAVSGEVRQ